MALVRVTKIMSPEIKGCAGWSKDMQYLDPESNDIATELETRSISDEVKLAREVAIKWLAW